MNQILSTLLRSQILMLALLLIGGGEAQARPSFSPILPLYTGKVSNVPLLKYGVRDPNIDKKTPTDEDEAEILIEEIEDTLDTMARAKNKKTRMHLSRKVMDLYGSLTYYYENAELKKSSSQTRRMTGKTRMKWIKSAGKYLTYLKKGSYEASRVLFYIHINRYLEGVRIKQSASGLATLAKKGKLNSYLKRRALLISHLDKYKRGNKKSEKSLIGLLAKLPSTSAIHTRLTIARTKAGVTSSGRKVNKANKKYRDWLWAATKKSKKLHPAQKKKVLTFVLSLWRMAEGSKSTWAKAPIYWGSFPGAKESKAVVERLALEEFDKNHISNAFKKYAALAKAHKSSNHYDALNRRILDMHAKTYARTGTYRPYEKEIIAQRKTFQERGSDSVLSQLKRRQSDIARKEYQVAKSKKASKKARLNTLKVLDRYLTVVDSDSEAEKLKNQQAHLWILNGSHKPAVGIYLELAKKKEGKSKRSYLEKAVASQSILAKWPTYPAWDKKIKSSKKERSLLKHIYASLNDTYGPSVNWTVSAQLGLLQLSLGQQSDAFALWNISLGKSPRGSHAAKASGIMITSFNKSKRWVDLEKLARHVRKHNLTPLHKGKSISVTPLLAKSLLEQGKIALSKNNHALAKTKLKDFVDNFRAANRDQGMFLLSAAYRGVEEHKNAIDQLTAFAEEYPKSRLYRKAMLLGGDWSIPMAYEESAIFFYENVLKHNSRDEESVRIRESLIQIYMGRRLYSEAIATMARLSKSDKLSKQERADVALKMMEAQELNGDAAGANRTLAAIKKLDADDGFYARSLATQARMAAKNDRRYNYTKVIKELDRLETTPATDEAHGEVLFYKAEASGKSHYEVIQSATIKDPKHEVKTRWSKYSRDKKTYLDVCGVQTSFCMAAQHQIARRAEDMVTVIQDIDIPENLDDKVINEFRSIKAGIINQLTQDTMEYDQLSMEAAEQGTGNPNWTRQVMLQNSADWDIESIGQEEASVYVQWQEAE